MKTIVGLTALAVSVVLVSGCGKQTLEEQITEDIQKYVTSEDCEEIVLGTVIQSVEVGKITPIGETGLVDISVELETLIDSAKSHETKALLYSKKGDKYTLEAIGGCEYER